MNTKLIIVALAAFTVGGTCPSDVNNDGTVGIQDFLQVLAEWGPCPEPSVIAVGGTDPSPVFVVRLWSTGLVQVRHTEPLSSGCWNCKEVWPPPFTWIDFGTPSMPNSDAKPVDLDFSLNGSRLFVAFTDGTIYRTVFEIINVDPCNGVPTGHCELVAPAWEEVP